MKIVCAYSGGLDTSVILHWLRQNYDAEIIAFCADIGQGEELEGLEQKALATGASRCYIENLCEEFAQDFIFPMFRAGAIYEGQYLLGTSIARPLIAKKLVEIAKAEGAEAMAHGATGKGNDQVRFELTAAALAPGLKVIAPWRLEGFRKQFPGRAEMIAYAHDHGIPIKASHQKPFSMDRNLLHISYEAGILEDPWMDPSAESNRDMFLLTTSPEEAPDHPEYIELLFENGDCTGLKSEHLEQYLTGLPANQHCDREGYIHLNPYWVVKALNAIGSKHGIGRADIIENRFVGMKSRGVYETPGGAILHHAHRQIESLTMDRELMRLRDSLIPKYSELVYNGFWFSPERKALQSLVDASQEHVSGVVRLKLYKGNLITAGRKSEKSLYHFNIATMEGDPTNAYDQSDATGFIKLNALRLRVSARADTGLGSAAD